MKNQIVPVVPISAEIEILTVHELALYLKTSEAKVYRLAHTGEVPAFRIGKSWRFTKKAIDIWIAQKTDACVLLESLHAHPADAI